MEQRIESIGTWDKVEVPPANKRWYSQDVNSFVPNYARVIRKNEEQPPVDTVKLTERKLNRDGNPLLKKARDALETLGENPNALTEKHKDVVFAPYGMSKSRPGTNKTIPVNINKLSNMKFLSSLTKKLREGTTDMIYLNYVIINGIPYKVNVYGPLSNVADFLLEFNFVEPGQQNAVATARLIALLYGYSQYIFNEKYENVMLVREYLDRNPDQQETVLGWYRMLREHLNLLSYMDTLVKKARKRPETTLPSMFSALPFTVLGDKPGTEIEEFKPKGPGRGAMTRDRLLEKLRDHPEGKLYRVETGSYVSIVGGRVTYSTGSVTINGREYDFAYKFARDDPDGKKLEKARKFVNLLYPQGGPEAEDLMDKLGLYQVGAIPGIDEGATTVQPRLRTEGQPPAGRPGSLGSLTPPSATEQSPARAEDVFGGLGQPSVVEQSPARAEDVFGRTPSVVEQSPARAEDVFGSRVSPPGSRRSGSVSGSRTPSVVEQSPARAEDVFGSRVSPPGSRRSGSVSGSRTSSVVEQSPARAEDVFGSRTPSGRRSGTPSGSSPLGTEQIFGGSA